MGKDKKKSRSTPINMTHRRKRTDTTRRNTIEIERILSFLVSAFKHWFHIYFIIFPENHLFPSFLLSFFLPHFVFIQKIASKHNNKQLYTFLHFLSTWTGEAFLYSPFRFRIPSAIVLFPSFSISKMAVGRQAQQQNRNKKNNSSSGSASSKCQCSRGYSENGASPLAGMLCLPLAEPAKLRRKIRKWKGISPSFP
jgi:hypothetical protein